MEDFGNLLSLERHDDVIEKYVLNLNELYPDELDRKAFEGRWDSFYKSDEMNDGVLFKDGHRITYLSERMIPDKDDGRSPLLLMFGNPAPSSINLKMIFSYEGNGREHRIWRIFRKIQLLNFNTDQTLHNQSREQLNSTRRTQLLELDYQSPFRLGFISFISMPSTPSTEPWTGVSGVRRLFGSNVFKRIQQAEKQKHLKIIREFMPKGGNVLVFQKDAYNILRRDNAPEYARSATVDGTLVSDLENVPNVKVHGVPPTRSLNGGKPLQALQDLITGFGET